MNSMLDDIQLLRCGWHAPLSCARVPGYARKMLFILMISHQITLVKYQIVAIIEHLHPVYQGIKHPVFRPESNPCFYG